MNRSGKSFLYLPVAPYVHAVEGEVSDIYDFGLSLENNAPLDVVVRFLRGNKMQKSDGLDDEFAAAMQFPWYYGGNWPAFDECLKDLSWMRAEGYLLFIYHSERILTDEDPQQFSILVRILQEVGEEWSERAEGSEVWSHPPTPFHVVLHTNAGEKRNLFSRLDSVAACYDEISWKSPE